MKDIYSDSAGLTEPLSPYILDYQHVLRVLRGLRFRPPPDSTGPLNPLVHVTDRIHTCVYW